MPGHERFIKNMLAGVGGIDLVLFMVAADESIKPQTREHFDICRLLGIPRGIIALTKADLVDADILGLVRLRGGRAGGRFVPGRRADRAGQLGHRRGPRRVAARTEARLPRRSREKNAAGYFRLPIDRVFSVKGFGTVVTGTLISGSVAKEQEVEVYPGGRRLRVRGVQVHGELGRRARAGQRTALNLADIEPADLARGDVLTSRAVSARSTQIDCRFDLLRFGQAAEASRAGSLSFRDGGDRGGGATAGRHRGAAPGERAYARLVLREPALLLPGDRFIVRMFSPVVTIGGGVVVDTGGRRYRKGDAVKARLETLHTGDAAARMALLVREARFGMEIAELVARTGMSGAEIAAAAAKAPVVTIVQPQPWYVDRAWMQAERERMVKAVREFHRKNPLLPGMPRQDLRGGAPVFVVGRTGGGSEGNCRRWRTGAFARAQNGAERGRGAGAGKDRAGLRGRRTGCTGDDRGAREMRCGAGARTVAFTDPAAGKTVGTNQRRTGVSPDRDRPAARVVGQAQGRTFSRTGVQGVDWHLAQVRDPAAGAARSRENYAPRRRRTRGAVAGVLSHAIVTTFRRKSLRASAARRDRSAIGPQVANLPHMQFHRSSARIGPRP